MISVSFDGRSTVNVKGYKDVGFSEMMEYYSPMWMAWGGLFASFVASLSLPLFGFVLSRYVFLIALPIDTEDHRDTFIEQRNFWSLMFLLLVLGIGISTFLQKI